MAVSAGMLARAAATALSNEKLRKGIGWGLVAVLSPVILLIAALCSIGTGGADHNNQAVAAAFYGTSYSTEVPMKVIASANTSMFDGVSVPKHLTTLFAERGIEVVGNYSGASSTGDLNLEKIAELKPDLIIMNIRHEKVYEQLAAIAPTVMIDDDISYVNWRGRFKQLGQWFDKEAAVEKWLADYDAKAAELAARIRDMIGDETFAVLEANSVHFGSYYIYRSGGPGELVYDELKLTPSAGVPENVWGEVVDAEYFSLIDADHIFFFSDDGRAGDTGNLAVWKNMKAVKAGNVYFGINEDQYNMAFTAMGKELYLEKLANAILNHGDVE